MRHSAAGIGAAGGGTGGGQPGGGSPTGGAGSRLPIQRLSIPGLAESAIRLHPGARDKLDRFTQNRKVRQGRAILGNLGLAGGIRGQDARYAFKSQVRAERKWNRMFGKETGGEQEKGGEGETSKCCADGSSPFPKNRHDEANHDPAANKPDAEPSSEATDHDAAPLAAALAEHIAAPQEPAGQAAAGPAGPDPAGGLTPEGHKKSDAERAAKASEARKVFDTRRSTQRNLAEIQATQAARRATHQERISGLGQRRGQVKSEVMKQFENPQPRGGRRVSRPIGRPSPRRDQMQAARARHSALKERLATRGVSRQGVKGHVEAHRQAQMVGDFFAMHEG